MKLFYNNVVDMDKFLYLPPMRDLQCDGLNGWETPNFFLYVPDFLLPAQGFEKSL